MTASTSVTAVMRSSYINLARPIIFLRTICSKNPPHQGVRSMLNIHSTPLPERYCLTSSCCMIALIVQAAALNALNVFPLSDTICFGKHLRAENRFKLRMKAEVVKSGTISTWMACNMQQVYKHIQTLLSAAKFYHPYEKWSCKIHPSIHERWVFCHSEFGQRGWWWSKTRFSFKSLAYNAPMD